MRLTTAHQCIALCVAAAATLPGVSAPAVGDGVADEFLLIDDELHTREIELSTIAGDVIEYRTPASRDDARNSVVPFEECLAIVRTGVDHMPAPTSFVLLSDGQRLPGAIMAEPAVSETSIAWKHPRLGRIDVPLDQVRSVVLAGIETLPEAGQSDVVVLNNGDRLEGFVASFGHVVEIIADLEGRSSTLRIPIESIVAATFVTPDRKAQGRRVWLDDGTILDVRYVEVGEDGYLDFVPILTGRSSGSPALQMRALIALLMDPQRAVALGAMAPMTVEAPVPRYVAPVPRVLDASAPLGMNRLEYQGPVVVRYALPASAARFAAEAVLPPTSRIWGDFELVIRDDEEVVHRSRINGSHPSASINVVLTGSELTIELTQGAHGPIHDRLHLQRALILIGD